MKLELSGAVGEGGTNAESDVQAVQQRLSDLGYTWVAVDGIMGPVTIGAIRLFQSIIVGRQAVGGDGRVDPGFGTQRWLEADNAPGWMQMPEDGPGFVNVERADREDKHDFGTTWLVDVLQSTGALYESEHLSAHQASPIAVNDASLPKGGDTPDHAGHETGLSIDMRLPLKDASTRGGRTWQSTDYDRGAMRAQLSAFQTHDLVERIFFNDPVLVSEGLCKFIHGHNNHVHIEIEPPRRA